MKVSFFQQAGMTLCAICVLCCSTISFASSLTEPLLPKTGKKESPVKAHHRIVKISSHHGSPTDKKVVRTALQHRLESAVYESGQAPTLSSWLGVLSLDILKDTSENVNPQVVPSQEVEVAIRQVLAARQPVTSESMNR